MSSTVVTRVKMLDVKKNIAGSIFGSSLALNVKAGIMVTLLSLCLMNSAWAYSKQPLAQIGNNKIKLEVASTPEQVERGLMYRTSLPEDHGMVFLFRPHDAVKFWMAHCFISLDMLFIKDGKIICIFENVPPCKASNEQDCPTYPSREERPILVTEVVEVNGGYAKRHGIKVGDEVKFNLGISSKTHPASAAAPNSTGSSAPVQAAPAKDSPGETPPQ